MPLPTHIGGASNGTATVGTTFTLTYTPKPGNMVAVFVHNGVVSALDVKDNNGNALTAGPTVVGAAAIRTSCFYGSALSGATSYIATWTGGSVVGISIDEFNNVGSVNASLAGNTSTSTSSTITVSQTLQANSIMLSGMNSRNATPTVTVGTQLQRFTGSSPELVTVQNGTGTAGAFSCTATLSLSVLWTVAAIELVGSSPNLGMMMGCGF